MRKTGEAIGSYVGTLMHTKEVLSEFIYRLNEKNHFCWKHKERRL